jgi:hypothetical protein
MLLMLSSAVNLTKRYGATGASQLRQRMVALEQDLSPQAGRAAMIFPDDADSAARYGLRAAAMSSPPVILQTLWTLQNLLGFSTNDTLLLLGGNDVIPFAELPNPAAGGSDSDMTIQSDSPYGFFPGRAAEAFQSGAVPNFAVGRLPDFQPANLDGFLALLNSLASPSARFRSGTFAVVNEAWRSPTDQILDGYGTIRTTPPWSASNSEWKTQDAQLLYFNLHGFNNSPAWRGFDEASGNWIDSVSPGDVVPDAVSGAIVFAENCYGGLVSGKSARNSVALSMLAAGARAFIGSTGIAYGSFMQQPDAPIEADVLGGDFVRQIRAGQTAGQAFRIARRDFSNATSPAGWEADRQKTISEFVLYGNPLATL